MFGIVVPAGTPVPVVEKLNATLKDILARPQVQEALLRQGAVATWTSPADTAARIATERKQWATVVAEAGVKPD